MARMSSREFTTWKVLHDKFHMFGEIREGLRVGEIVSPLLNLLMARWMKNPTYHKPSEWIFDFWKEVEKAKPQSIADMKLVLKAMAGVGVPTPKGRR